MFIPIGLLLTGHCGPGFHDQIFLMEVQNADAPSIESSESSGPPEFREIPNLCSWHPSAVVQFMGKHFVGIPLAAIQTIATEWQHIGCGGLPTFDLGAQFMEYVVSHLQPPLEPHVSDTESLLSSQTDWDENSQLN